MTVWSKRSCCFCILLEQHLGQVTWKMGDFNFFKNPGHIWTFAFTNLVNWIKLFWVLKTSFVDNVSCVHRNINVIIIALLIWGTDGNNAYSVCGEWITPIIFLVGYFSYIFLWDIFSPLKFLQPLVSFDYSELKNMTLHWVRMYWSFGGWNDKIICGQSSRQYLD